MISMLQKLNVKNLSLKEIHLPLNSSNEAIEAAKKKFASWESAAPNKQAHKKQSPPSHGENKTSPRLPVCPAHLEALPLPGHWGHTSPLCNLLGVACKPAVIFCVLLLGIPCMLSEFIIGRHGASNTFRA